jgi:hypothetical protein
VTWCNAMSRWKVATAQISNASLAGPLKTYSASLVKGALYSIRLAFGNAAGVLSCTLDVASPNYVITSHTYGFSVQKWCGILPFPNWTWRGAAICVGGARSWFLVAVYLEQVLASYIVYDSTNDSTNLPYLRR